MNTLFLMHFLSEAPPPEGKSLYNEDNLHITFLSHVECENEYDKNLFIKRIEQVAESTKPFIMKPNGQALFGVNQNKPVITLSDGKYEGKALHLNLLAAAFKTGLFSTEPERFLGMNFSPHMTVYKEQQSPDFNQEIWVNHISLVSHIGGFGSGEVEITKNLFFH